MNSVDRSTSLRGTVLRLPHSLTGELVEYRIPPRLAAAAPNAFAAFDTPTLRALATTTFGTVASQVWLWACVSTLAARSGWLRSIDAQFPAIWGESAPFRVALLCATPARWVPSALQSMHAKLVRQTSSPWRAMPVWMGGVGIHRSSFVPPPPAEVPVLMHDLCGWLNRSDIAPHVRHVMAYVQLGAIHPFVDGNGRLARWLWLATAPAGVARATVLGPLLLAISSHAARLHEVADALVRGALEPYADWLCESAERMAECVPRWHQDLDAAFAQVCAALQGAGLRADLATRCAHSFMLRPVVTEPEFQRMMGHAAARVRQNLATNLLSAGVLDSASATTSSVRSFVVQPVKSAWAAIARDVQGVRL